jgi:hypothetical protein
MLAAQFSVDYFAEVVKTDEELFYGFNSWNHLKKIVLVFPQKGRVSSENYDPRSCIATFVRIKKIKLQGGSGKVLRLENSCRIIRSRVCSVREKACLN